MTHEACYKNSSPLGDSCVCDPPLKPRPPPSCHLCFRNNVVTCRLLKSSENAANSFKLQVPLNLVCQSLTPKGIFCIYMHIQHGLKRDLIFPTSTFVLHKKRLNNLPLAFLLPYSLPQCAILPEDKKKKNCFFGQILLREENTFCFQGSCISLGLLCFVLNV